MSEPPSLTTPVVWMRLAGAALTFCGLLLPSHRAATVDAFTTAERAVQGASGHSGLWAAAFCLFAAACAFRRARWLCLIAGAVLGWVTPSLAADQFQQGGHGEMSMLIGRLAWPTGLVLFVLRRCTAAVEFWLALSAIAVSGFHDAFALRLYVEPDPAVGYDVAKVGTWLILLTVLLQVPWARFLRRIAR